ncbi:MAG: hypothetical protein WC855_02375 [Thermodesulfovibrionales bacterium]
MRNILCFLAVSIICFGMSAFSYAQDLKTIYNFDAWLGKAGEIKQEPPLDLMPLPGWVLIGKTTGDDGTTYTFGETQDKPLIVVTVKAHAAVADAQTGLLNILSQFSMILLKAETQGLKFGDVGFAMSEGDVITFIAFVRNNVTVVIKNISPDNPKSVKDIAGQIDLMI